MYKCILKIIPGVCTKIKLYMNFLKKIFERKLKNEIDINNFLHLNTFCLFLLLNTIQDSFFRTFCLSIQYFV